MFLQQFSHSRRMSSHADQWHGLHASAGPVPGPVRVAVEEVRGGAAFAGSLHPNRHGPDHLVKRARHQQDQGFGSDTLNCFTLEQPVEQAGTTLLQPVVLFKFEPAYGCYYSPTNVKKDRVQVLSYYFGINANSGILHQYGTTGSAN